MTTPSTDQPAAPLARLALLTVSQADIFARPVALTAQKQQLGRLPQRLANHNAAAGLNLIDVDHDKAMVDIRAVQQSGYGTHRQFRTIGDGWRPIEPRRPLAGGISIPADDNQDVQSNSRTGDEGV